MDSAMEIIFRPSGCQGLPAMYQVWSQTKKDRGKGYGVKLLDHAKKLAKERGCKAITLDSGLPRVQAHGFYEHYGFEKSCYGFELAL